MKINPSTQISRRRRGFTLLEMVIVLGIIGIILGGIGYKMIGALETAKIRTAQGDMKGFASMLMQYKMNGGSYPTQGQGLKALVSKPTTTPVPKMWVKQLKEEPKDPWGNPYRYQFPSKKAPGEYEIISNGPDLLPNTDDDINSQDD